MAFSLLAAASKGQPQRLPDLLPEVVSVEGLRPELVRLSVSVADRDGQPVIGLTREDFDVREAGARRPLLDFGRERDRADRPLSAVMLVDMSTSVQRELDKWREAALALLSALRPIDELRVATFTDSVTVVQEFTSDPVLLRRSVEGFRAPGGGTRILRSVEETLLSLRNRAGRKVIFLLTDGLEEDREQGLEDLIRYAVRTHVTVVTVLTGPSSFPDLPAQRLALATGGWWVYPGADLPARVRRLGERLLESYLLVYESERDPADGRRRPVSVTLTDPAARGHEVRTVAGVFGDTPLLDVLAIDLEDDDEGRRARAAADLGGVRVKGAIDLLGRAAKDGSPKVRAAAASSLGLRPEAAAIRWLARLTRDDVGTVRKAAIAGLTRLQSSTGDPALQSRILEELERAGRAGAEEP